MPSVMIHPCQKSNSNSASKKSHSRYNDDEPEGKLANEKAVQDEHIKADRDSQGVGRKKRV